MNNTLETQIYNLIYALCAFNIILFVTSVVSSDNIIKIELKISIIANTILQIYPFSDNIYKLLKFPSSEQKLLKDYIEYISYCFLFLSYCNIIVILYISYNLAIMLEISYIITIIIVSIPFLNLIRENANRNNNLIDI